MDDTYLSPYVKSQEIADIFPQVQLAHQLLHEKTGPGNSETKWLTLPKDYDKSEFERIKRVASTIQTNSEILIVIGIGGSYLGARAVIEAVCSNQYNATCDGTPQIYFIGNSVSGAALHDLLTIIDGKDFSINMISKSGTTTEPAIAFRVLRDLLYQRYGEAASERIFVTTDKAKGTLKEVATKEGYETFVVPDGVGGRYSVLSAVGLLPIAVAGVDIDRLMGGAHAAMQELAECTPQNDCYRYAAVRNILYHKGKSVELLASFEPDFTMMNEWFKQLFGESEGKGHRGLFPASTIYTTDLHSMGQYVQDGARLLFETVVDVKEPRHDVLIPPSADADGLDYLEGQSLHHVNQKAMQGTILAHNAGGIPVVVLEIPKLTAYHMGYLIYFFEKACAISGYMLGVNPFDQPGVESYKTNMFALLGKPGFEAHKKELEALLEKDRKNQ